VAWIPRRRRPPRRSPPSSAILRHPPPSSAILRLGVSFSPAAARLGRRRSRRRGVRTPADGAPIATTRSSQSPTSGNATECKSDAFEHSTIVDFEGLAPTCEGREHCKVSTSIVIINLSLRLLLIPPRIRPHACRISSPSPNVAPHRQKIKVIVRGEDPVVGRCRLLRNVSISEQGDGGPNKFHRRDNGIESLPPTKEFFPSRTFFRYGISSNNE
jgi:hypothetical protein